MVMWKTKTVAYCFAVVAQLYLVVESFSPTRSSGVDWLSFRRRRSIIRQYCAIDHELSPPQTQPRLGRSTIQDEDGLLASLFGSVESRDLFLDHSLGVNFTYYPRMDAQLPAPLRGKLDLESLYETNEFIAMRKRGSFDYVDKTQTTMEALTDYIAGGGSAVIPVTPKDYLSDFKKGVERCLGYDDGNETSMNIYHSGPSAKALNIHYDTYDVIVLHLDGKKDWIVQGDSFGKKMSDITLWHNITLSPGDVLYLPKGVFHAATTAEGYDITTHITIGLT